MTTRRKSTSQQPGTRKRAAAKPQKQQAEAEQIASWCPQGEITIYSAMENKANLLELLQVSDAVTIDLSKVCEIDTAGLQLLILAKREAEQAGKKLQLSGHSDAVLDAFELCNLSTFFGDPVVIPSAKNSAESC